MPAPAKLRKATSLGSMRNCSAARSRTAPFSSPPSQHTQMGSAASGARPPGPLPPAGHGWPLPMARAPQRTWSV
eukprot:4636937-Alexandrium_andersonii.AAC.1